MRRLSSLVCLICIFSWLAPSAFAQAERAPIGTIQGRVTAGEKPLANISVGLIRVDRQSPTQRLTIASTTTDAEGRYRLTDVPGCQTKSCISKLCRCRLYLNLVRRPHQSIRPS